MKLGFDLGYSGAQMTVPLDRILRAEAVGFDSIWAAESYGSDVFSPLAYIAAKTERIRLCTGIAQLAARAPASCAMTAQTIDALAGKGRMVVGLGVSGPQIVEGWYGQPWGEPAERLRDYVAILRKVWRRDAPVTHDGKELPLPYAGADATGLGKPLKSIIHGNPDIPVMLGTSTPGNIRLTGEIADGWLSMHIGPAQMPEKLKLLEQGIAKRNDGKTLSGLEIVANASLILTDDVAAAFAQIKPRIALYVGGMGAQKQNYHKDVMVERGFRAEADRIQELFLAGYKAEAAAAVPDAFVDEGALVGPERRIAERFARWRDSGITLLRLNNPDEPAIDAIARIART